LTVIVDPRDVLLAVVNHEVPESEFPIRGLLAASVSHRLSAIRLMTEMEDAYIEKLMKDSSWVVRGMIIQYLTDHSDADRLYRMSLREQDVELQYFILESISGLDPEKAKAVAMHMIQTANRVPVIYAAISAIAAVDVAEASQQLERFKDNESDAIYALRAKVYAEKGNMLTMDFFKNPVAGAINDNYFEEFIRSFLKYLSAQNASIQEEGLELIQSDFFLSGPTPEYRRFYLITTMADRYQSEDEGLFKSKLHDAIRSLYIKVKDDYIKGVLKEGLGDLVD
jgi:hypothetical protein